MGGSIETSGELFIYREVPPKKAPGTQIKSVRGLKLTHLPIQIFCLLGVFSIAVALIRDAATMTSSELFVLLGVLAILIICLIVPESMHQNNVRSLTPIIIFESGVQIYTPWYRRLFGEPDFISGSMIEKLEIDVGDDFTDSGIFANAPKATGPISFKLKTVNGDEYYSGHQKVRGTH